MGFLGLVLLLGLGYRSLFWQRWLYPQSYRAQITRLSERYGISPSLVWALIRQESNFQPTAVSPVGAQGLMQLMPETAHWVDSHLEGHPPRSLDLQVPETNLRLGVAYLGYLSVRFPGDVVAMLAAYNAGPEPVLDWRGRGARGKLRLEDIGYPETRAYVEKVLRNQQNYRRLYPELRWEGTNP